MAIRIEWDEFEIALLIEACEEVLRKGKPKSEVVKTVSSNLRKRAISKNIAIDDVFRNENGIALQMQKMAYLLTHGEKGMPGASKLYAEVAELREENPKKFEEILKRAKEEIEMTDLSQQNIDKKALFAQWLNERTIKKYTPSAIIDALDVASRYCVSKKVCKDGFWSMQNKAEFNAVASKLLSFRLFRLKYRSAAAKMDKAIPLYKAFLDSYVASREENTAEFEGEALNEPDSMLSTAAANSDDIIRLDFSDIGSLVFSRPVCLNYKDHTFTDFNSWASLYAKVAFLLKQDYPQIIVDGGSLSEGAAQEFSMNLKALRKPKAITDGLFIETNHSATEIASRIATLLRLCGVDLNEVSITYTLKKEAEQKRTSQSRSENEKLYEKLYSISRIYDDPAGLSLNRITGLLGRSDDRELVQGILDHAPWAHRIENGIYSFSSADTISARNEKKAGKDDTISDSAFYDYLDKTLCMAEPTCRSYVSAIRSAEKYAKDYGFTSYRIYDVTTSDAVALLNALMRDDGFAAYNIRQHNRFRAAFTKFAEMAGQSIVVKKTGAQLQNKPQEQPIAPFDKEKYIEILMCRYRNGITFDSIDFDNFRETYEDLYDSSIDADDDTLEKQLRLCGVFYNNRLFPAEGIMDDETREKLFTYIENSFSSGKKVLYYKAVFEDLADAFANCYSLADEHMLRVFIEFTADPDKYYFFKDYMSVEANVKIDDTAEVEDFLLSAGKPMKVEDVCTALTHIPKERVDSIIKFDSRFRRNAKGEYFHADIFEISEPELEKIAAIIDGSIAENGYAIWTDIWNIIQETMPVFLENNLYLSALGVRNAISAHYLGKFNFNGAVISRPEDRYGNMGVEFDWLTQYFNAVKSGFDFWTSSHSLGTNKVKYLKSFLQDSGVATKKRNEKEPFLTRFGEIIADIGIDEPLAWGLIACNWSYSSQFGWWVRNIEFNNSYSPEAIFAMLDDTISETVREHVVSAFKNIFISIKPLANEIGLGICDYEEKSTGRKLNSIIRFPWANPDERVILYSLYLFSEKCGNYKQFTLTRLLDTSIESDGISPTQIFGLNRDTMEKILNGLTFNYPDLIEARFTLGLDNITLKSDKSAEEILNELF